MIRTFPEARLVVLSVYVAFGVATPEPLAAVVVYQVFFNVSPASVSLFEGFLVAKMLIKVSKANHRLGLNPPVAVYVDIARIEVSLVNHASVGVQALLAGFGYHLHNILNLSKKLLVAKHQSRLVHQPRALYVVSVTLECACTSRPVLVKEEVEMVRIGVQNLVGKDVNEVAERFFKTLVLPDAIKVGIRLDDVQMRVLRLRIVGIEF